MSLRAALLPLLVLLCASVACSTNAGAARTPQGTPEAQTAQEGQGAALQSKNAIGLSSTATTYASATPNEAGTLAVMSLNATLDTERFERQSATETKGVSLTQSVYVAQTVIAQKPAQVATKNQQSTQNALTLFGMTQSADNRTATAEYPTLVFSVAQSEAQAKAAPFAAFAYPVFMILGSLALLIIAGGVVWVLVQKPAEPTPEIDDETIEREESSPLGTAQYPGAIIVSIPQYIASDRQLKIVADALAKGTSLTHANFTPFEKCFSEGGFTKFCDYLSDNVPPFAVRMNPTIKNSAIEPLPSLRHYLKRYATPTAPPRESFYSRRNYSAGGQTDRHANRYPERGGGGRF